MQFRKHILGNETRASWLVYYRMAKVVPQRQQDLFLTDNNTVFIYLCRIVQANNARKLANTIFIT